jgi:serine protease Do
MRSILRTTLVATGLAATALGIVALVVMFAPLVQAQVSSREPLSEFRAQLLGGSQIGVEIRDVDATDVKRDKLASAAGAVVEDVRSNGPAAKAGMKAGDIIVSFDGETIRSARQLSRLVDETPAGREVPAIVVRNGQKVTLTITPAAAVWADSEVLRDLRTLRLPERLDLEWPALAIRRDGGLIVRARGGHLGVGIQDLTGQLAEYFGVKEGVLVTAVDEDTPAQRAGLKAGDVIVKVGTSVIKDSRDLSRALAEAQGDTSIAVVRDRKAQTVTARIDDGLVRRDRIVK